MLFGISKCAGYLHRFRIVALVAMELMISVVAAADQVPPETTATAPLTQEAVAERLKQLEAANDLDPALKSKLLEFARQSADELKVAAERQAKAAEYEKAAANASTRLATLKCELEEPSVPAAELVPGTSSAADLEQQLVAAEAALVAERKKLAVFENEPKRRSLRRVEIGKLSAAASARLTEVHAEIADSAGTDRVDPTSLPGGEKEAGSAALAAAAQMLRRARAQAVVAELALYQQELASYDAASGELLAMERDRQARVVSQLEKRVDLLRTTVGEARRGEAEQQAREARGAAAAADPAIRRLAEQNQTLAEERKQLAGKIESVSRETETIAQHLKDVADHHRSVLEKEKAAGLTNAIGQLLRKERTELPDLRQIHQQLAQRQEEIAGVQLRLFDLEDRRRQLADLDPLVQDALSRLRPPSRVDESELRALLEAERAYLDSLIADSDTYFNRLVALDAIERRLFQETEKLAAYIDERVLWIRSAAPLSPDDLPRLWQAGVWMVDFENWRAGALALWNAWHESQFAGTLLTAALVVLIVAQKKLRQRIDLAGKRANRLYMPTILPTIQAVVATVALAAGWPLAIACLGWVLNGSRHEFSQALGAGLQTAAGIYFPLEMLRQALRPFGIAQAHFRWPREPLAAIRRRLRWLMLFGLPLVLVASTIQEQSNDAWRDSFARLGFVAIMLFLSAVVYSVLAQLPRGSSPATIEAQPGFARQLRLLWHASLAGVPIALGLLAATGYYYTALRLTLRLQSTVWLVLAIVFIHALLVRCLRVAHRRLENRAEAQRDDEASEAAVASEAGTVPLEQPAVDLGTVSRQTQRLLRSVAMLGLMFGAGWIWIDVLPALGVFNRVHLWQDADRNVAITLADLAISLVVAVMTVIAARNLPGLLEIAILQRLPIEPASRFAISTVSRYLIVVVGLVLAGAAIGVGWSQVQWLVAAVTFGLGFGLQEIFANFVSGLIILFERPMRVGDVVTVRGVSGIVSRIRMRATTITDWDRKELIVPNKEFITGQLVNWTLSDRVLRIVFRIGVAYGSDTRLVQRLLLKAAFEHPSVLADPSPQALFVAFADSTLAFELRVYVPGLEVYGAVQHELNTAIDSSFRAAGIEIAFPQCDVHLRSIDSVLSIERRHAGPRAFVPSSAVPEPPHAASA